MLPPHYRTSSAHVQTSHGGAGRGGAELKTQSPGHERTPHGFAHARLERRRRFAESHVYSSFIKGREVEALAPPALRRGDACALLPPKPGACSLNALHWCLPRKWKEASPKRAGGGSRKKDGGNSGGRSRTGARRRVGARRDSISEAVESVMGDGVALLRPVPALAVGLGGERLRLGLGVSRRHRDP